jgi:hypothetical protein
MRCIAQYEDVLCGLSHETKRTGNLSLEMSAELGEILEKIPSHDYLQDLEAVRETLVIPRRSTKSRTNKLAKSMQSSHRSTFKKKLGRKSSR